MHDKPLIQKDPRWEDILKDFRNYRYDLSFEKSCRYYSNAFTGRDFPVLTKDRATVAYTIAASAYGIQINSRNLIEKVFNTFFQFLDEYICLCIKGTDENRLEGWHTGPPRTLLGDCLELLCRFKHGELEELVRQWFDRFNAIKIPGWGHELSLPVLREKLFNERMKFDHDTHVENTRSLCHAYLALSETVASKFTGGRAQVMNVLSDLAYFQGGEKGEEQALYWADRCLEINPDDNFASVQKKFIQERLTVQHQIRRFRHDTDTAMAGIKARLDLLINKGYIRGTPAEKDLRTMKKELKRISGINRFIRNEIAKPVMINPCQLAKELVMPFTSKAAISINPEHADIEWNTDPDYLAIALDNLIKNAVEAFERRKIPLQERSIRVIIITGEDIIIVEDNAGGIDQKIKGKIFEPYVSSKGIKKETGLGLPTAVIAVEKLGGKLELSSKQPDKGTRFEINICKNPRQEPKLRSEN